MRKKIDRDAFVAAWRAAGSLDEVMAATGLSRLEASAAATRLRKQGVELKKFCERAQRPESLSDRAARFARERRVSFRVAGAELGISGQAVQQSYARLYPGEDPPGLKVLEGDPVAREVAMVLARDGQSDEDVAAEVGFSLGYVRRIRLDAGINRADEKDAAMRAAVELVRSGVSAVRAAAECGVSYGRLAERCREVGVALNGRSGRRNGQAGAAADLVETEGLTVAQAARRVGCVDSAVHGVLKRRRLLTGG
jgi:hypothetical protein